MKYYLHRISQHTEWSHPLLDEKHLLSIGWADYGASRDFLAQHEDKWSSVASTVERDYPKARPRFGLQRFLEMAQGDRVVVPTWGAVPCLHSHRQQATSCPTHRKRSKRPPELARQECHRHRGRLH